MRKYLTLDLYMMEDEQIQQSFSDENGEPETDYMQDELITDDDDQAESEQPESAQESAPRPYRSITVSLDKGRMVIKSVSDDSYDDYEEEYPEQLTNEFLIQTELLDIRKWDPMRYSPAFAGNNICSWELDYNGLKGGEAVRSGKGTYPKEWPLLMDLIDAYNSKAEQGQESVHIAAEYASLLIDQNVRDVLHSATWCGNEDHTEGHIDEEHAQKAFTRVTASPVTRMVDMVNILAAMRMPQDVVAAGVLRAVSDEPDYDPEFARGGFDGPVGELLEEYGDDSGLPLDEKRRALIRSVKASESMYFKKLVLAEVLADLIRVKAGIEAGLGFSDPVMSKEEMGLYYAEIIAALGELESDERAGLIYSVLVDMYKSVFVSYSLDSVRGVIYQMQGQMAGVMLRRGEYDWRAMQGSLPDDACPVSKDLALFLADRWRKQADEAIVRDGNKTGLKDVPDLTVLKVVMEKTRGKKARKDNKVALSVLKRMVDEGEQVLAALHADDRSLRLIGRGDIDDVANIPVSFLGLEDDEGNKMAAVFTSMEEIGEIDEEDIQAVPLKTLLRFVKHMDRLDGIIIDPFSDRFLVTKEKIADMLDDLSKEPEGM